ncbi:MAG TPA: ATP-binding cassette domain-containing protein, partial [Chromatiaceae bacterium]|nr:ATP-binding cassette domain-containing protein [Chromatiaceae bacterium]
MSSERLRIEDLAIDLITGNGIRSMVRDVYLVLKVAQPLSLVGETGCGKTLIAQAILGLLAPDMRAKGRIEYRGQNLLGLSRSEMRRLWGRNIFLFPQEPILALTPTMRAFSQVREVFAWIRRHDGRDSSKRTRSAFIRAGLTSLSDWRKYPCQLSGGMRQR